MSRKLGAVPQNKKGGLECSLSSKYGDTLRERERTLELMNGQLPSAFTRLSDPVALNTRTQKDSSEQRRGQSRQRE